MARFDKYDPKVGGFRAPLAAAFGRNADGTVDKTNFGTIFGASLNESGQVVLDGSGQTGVVGIIVLTSSKDAGDIVDVMTTGEVVEYAIPQADGTELAAAPGTVQFLDPTGNEVGPDANVTAGSVRIGHTVEAERLVVRVEPGVTGGSAAA